MAETNKNKNQGNQSSQGTSSAGNFAKSGQENQGNQGTQSQHGQGQHSQGQHSQGQHGQGQGGGTGVAQMAKDAAGSVKQAATGFAHSAADQAQHAASTVGGGMRTLAGTIRQNAPHEGMLGTAAESVAGSIESGGRYLEQEGFSGMVDDVSAMVRRNPLPSILCCVGVGFVLGWLMTSSNHSSRSY